MKPSLLVVACLAASSFACGPEETEPQPTRSLPISAEFVGMDTCQSCHPGEAAAWRGSHHDLAMQEATPETVLGDFDDSIFTYGGVTSTFFRRGNDFYAITDGPDGELTEYRIKYTFGVEPLQQYLLEFGNGRLQALNVVWDSRPEELGGQRWFHLYGNDRADPVDHRDPVHWTGVYQNWNQQCAECHSTNLEKGYDSISNRYETTFSEIDVACETCHGPGSAHVEWAGTSSTAQSAMDAGLLVDLSDRSGGGWLMNPDTGIAARATERSSRQQIESCGRCHSRRSAISATYEHGKPLLDTHRLALLDQDLYYADGQIQGEVYVYGSFVQSKMFRAGVTCNDCHNPHSLTIEDPDAVCAKCHLPAKFDNPSHHFHQPQSAGASCVECHMKSTVYMGVDGRRDHSFRIPRPDLSLALGLPNACSECHHEREPSWLARVFAENYPTAASRPSFASAIDSGRRQLPGARQQLSQLALDASQPPIARGSALMLMASPGLADAETLSIAGDDPEPLVRFGAAQGSEGLMPADRTELLSRLFEDPIRAVRSEAARVASISDDRSAEFAEPAFLAALDEFIETQEINSDRPDGQLMLALIDTRRGDFASAELAFQRALEIDPHFIPAYINYADLLRANNRDREGESLLRQGLSLEPLAAPLHHSLGLLLIRQQDLTSAITSLEEAARLAPGIARYGFVHAIALHSAGDSIEALTILELVHAQHPGDLETLRALVTINAELGRSEASRKYAEKLSLLN